MKTLITPALKDAILDHFVQTYDPGDIISVDRSESIHGVSDSMLYSILKQFESIGLIRKLTGTSDSIIFFLEAKSHEFTLRGGFYGQELLFQKSVEDLLFEIDKVKPSFSQQAEKITTIAANVAAFLAAIKGG